MKNSDKFENLIPDDIIDTFYKRIEKQLERGYNVNDKVIQIELNRIKQINNGIIPDKINNLIKT